jgi:hypothetical protein
MKIRTALPLLFVVGFLMVSSASSGAHVLPCPCDLNLTFDSTATIIHHLDRPASPVTIHGTVLNPDGMPNYKVKITSPNQWVISTKINGTAVHDGDALDFPIGQTLPIEIIVTPYGEGPGTDTESYCISFLWNSTKMMGTHCLTLVTTNATTSVSADMPIPEITLVPNPAGSYISVRGLSDMQFGYSYDISSTSGADVLHGIVPADARINLHGLSSGAYRLLLSDGRRTIANTAFTVVR